MSATGDRNKIAQTLSQKDLEEFVDECFNTPGLTLAKIQDLAAKRGISISLMGATSFRDTTFKKHLERLAKARELADQVAEMRKSGGSIADAMADVFSHEVFDALTNRDPDEPLDMDLMSKVIARIRAGDQSARESERRAKESATRVTALEAQLREREAKEQERKSKVEEARTKLSRAKSGGLTPDTLKTIEEALGL